MARIHFDRKETQWVSLFASSRSKDTKLNIRSSQDTDVLYLRLFSKDIVVLNSPKAIYDLAEKRSNIYSDRVSHLI